jgi:tripartite-type tricarboxylate transporter receptor subunit TctC
MHKNSTTLADRRRFLSITGFAAVAALCGTTHLQVAAQSTTYPSRPIKFVVPFPPGSGTDGAARIFAKKIGELTGQATFVENRPGGNGFIGARAVMNAPADGYTIFIGSNSTLSTNAAVFKKLPYDPLTDFTPITLLSRGPCLIIVPANSPYTKLEDLIADGHKRPMALNYGSGSVSYTLYSEWLNDLVKMKTTNVPYKGAGDVVNAVLSGIVDYAVVDASGAAELVRSGKIRALAYAAPQRHPLLPDVPTSAEAGVPEFLAYNWVAAAVSAKTPPAVAQRIGKFFVDAGATPEVKDYFLRQSTSLILSGPAELRQYQTDEIARWKRLAVVAKIELQ